MQSNQVTVIKFRMDNGGGNGAGCFEVDIIIIIIIKNVKIRVTLS